MKIAFFSDFTAPPQNGVWTSIVNLSSTLCRLGHEVIIFTPNPSRRKSIKLVDERIVIKFLPSVPGLLYPDLRLSFPVSPRLIQKIKALNIDIIHVHSPLAVGLGGIFIGKMLKIPIIGTQHNYAMEEDFLEIIDIHYMTKQVSSFLWKYTSFLLNQCDHVIAPMAMIKKDLVRHNIRPPITVLPNTIQEDAIHYVDEQTVSALHKRLGLSDRVVLFVGRLSKEKSIDILLTGFSHVLKKRDDVSLLIIGDGPQRESHRKLAKKLGILKNVTFAGELDQENLLTNGYYQLADMFVSASMTEVQPVSFIEAFFFGLPIIGTTKLGSFEMINRVGLLSEPDSPTLLAKNILLILDDSALKEKLSLLSKEEYKKRYDSKTVAHSYISLCHNLLNRHSRHA